MISESYFKHSKKVNIPDWEVDFTAVRSSGPGGQNVNKTASKVQVSFNVDKSKALSDEQKQKVKAKLKNHINKEGELILSEQTSRSQYTNRVNAFKKLENLINEALITNKERIDTEIPHFIKERRVDEKKIRSKVKAQRRGKVDFD